MTEAYALSATTADQLRRLIDAQGGVTYGSPRPRGMSRQWALVECGAYVGTLPGTSQKYYNAVAKMWQSDDGVTYGYVEDATLAACFLTDAKNSDLNNAVIYTSQHSGFHNTQPLFVTAYGTGALVTVRVLTNFCPGSSGG